MREIKFRAFSRTRNEMEYDISITTEGKGIRCGFQWFSPANDLLHEKVMQYTGLKDKNGVEIYDGDIVQWYGKIFVIHVDEFNSYRFMIHKDFLNRAYADDSIIIGNIYENPELLPV